MTFQEYQAELAKKQNSVLHNSLVTVVRTINFSPEESKKKLDDLLQCVKRLDVGFGKPRDDVPGVTEADFERFIILGKSFDTLDIYDRLEQIHCPTLVLGAIDDKVLTAQASFEIAQKLGCACYFYESKYGHCAFDEAPDYKQRTQ